MATAAELSDELERTRTRLAAVTSVGQALAYFHELHLERGQLALDVYALRSALAEWRAVTTS